VPAHPVQCPPMCPMCAHVVIPWASVCCDKDAPAHAPAAHQESIAWPKAHVKWTGHSVGNLMLHSHKIQNDHITVYITVLHGHLRTRLWHTHSHTGRYHGQLVNLTQQPLPPSLPPAPPRPYSPYGTKMPPLAYTARSPALPHSSNHMHVSQPI
jgi:hypothetical protein